MSGRFSSKERLGCAAKSGLHAGSFVAVLIMLAVVGHFLDQPKGMLGTMVGGYGHQLILDIGIAITLAVSLNLILGIGGQFSLGHAGFVAAGAYTSVILAGNYFAPQVSFWMYGPLHLSVDNAFAMVMVTGMIAGGLVAAVLGLAVGLPTLRLRGDYLAIATLGFGEILVVFITNTEFLGRATGLSLTGLRGEWLASQENQELPLVVAVQGYQDNAAYFVSSFWVFAVAAMTIFIVHNIKYATSGRALLAVREDAVASESVGVPTTKYKVSAFVIGAAIAGMAGGLISHHKPLVNPESFRFMRSIELVAMVILGGQGSITGAILAAIGLTLLPEALRSYVPERIVSANVIEKWRMVIYSLCIILLMLFRPQGIFGRYELSDLVRWVFGRKKGGERAAANEVTAGISTLVAEKAEVREKQVEQERPLLEAERVTMRFGGLCAVDSFGLRLLPGELVGLIGPNGAGKTTVFNVLTGVYRPTSGDIRVCEKSIVRLKPNAISKRGIGRTFQNIRLFANLSVIDNVMIAQHAHHKQGIPAAILRTPQFYAEERESRERAMGYLDIFGLAGVAEEQANSLSYGDQRRLEIARALATRPKLLLLDEPAAGMNPTEKRELMDLIRTIRARFGLTILIIEHDMKVIMGICQRIVVLDYGKTIASGTPEEIRRNPAVIEAYLGASAKQG